MMTLTKWYKSKLKKKIETEMVKSLDKLSDAEMRSIVSKQIFPSKRIRSYFLHLLCNRKLSKDDFIILSVAIELYHQATLIFDDIIDDDDKRDGNRVALHKQFKRSSVYADGVASHIAALLIILSDKYLLSLKAIDIKQVIEIFNDTRLSMFNSQFVDTLTTAKPPKKNYTEWLINNSYRKTSSFIELPFKIYCLTNNLKSKKAQDIISFGTNLGIVYQIGDDLFDIKKGIKKGTLTLTYPLAYLLDNKRILNAKKLKIINKIMSTKTLTKQTAQEITLLFRTHARQIVDSAYAEIEKRKKKILNAPISDKEKNEMMLILDFVKIPSYWEYKAPEVI